MISSQNIDTFLRRHPGVFILLISVLALLVAAVLLAEASAPDVVYRAF